MFESVDDLVAASRRLGVNISGPQAGALAGLAGMSAGGVRWCDVDPATVAALRGKGLVEQGRPDVYRLSPFGRRLVELARSIRADLIYKRAQRARSVATGGTTNVKIRRPGRRRHPRGVGRRT
jgi:hypothetical protein